MTKFFGSAGVVGLLATSITALAAYLVAKMNRPKIAADTRRVDIDTETVAVSNAEKVVEILGKRLDVVEAQHAKCQEDVNELREGRIRDRRRIDRLERALRENGIPIPNEA